MKQTYEIGSLYEISVKKSMLKAYMMLHLLWQQNTVGMLLIITPYRFKFLMEGRVRSLGKSIYTFKKVSIG